MGLNKQDPPPNHGLIAPITLEETRNCLRRMKNGPDEIPKFGNCLGSLGVLVLADLFNHIFNTEMMVVLMWTSAALALLFLFTR